MRRMILFCMSVLMLPVVWAVLYVARTNTSWYWLCVDTYEYYLSGDPYGVFDGGLHEYH
jgi:hypothetical protein